MDLLLAMIGRVVGVSGRRSCDGLIMDLLFVLLELLNEALIGMDYLPFHLDNAKSLLVGEFKEFDEKGDN